MDPLKILKQNSPAPATPAKEEELPKPKAEEKPLPSLKACYVTSEEREKLRELEKRLPENWDKFPALQKLKPDDIVKDPTVRGEMEKAFAESKDNSRNPTEGREQGGWIIQKNGKLEVQRYSSGESAQITPSTRPPYAVARFHTHPYSALESLCHQPSIPIDAENAVEADFPIFVIDRKSIFQVDPRYQDGYREIVMR